MVTKVGKNVEIKEPISMNGCFAPISAGLLTLFLLSCVRTIPPERYLEKFERQKAKHCITINRNGITASVLCMPAKFFAARDARLDTTLQMDKAEKRYNNSLFFTLSIRPDSQSKPGSFLLTKGGYAEFKNNVMLNSFGRENDIFLLHKNDTIPIAGIQYNRDWGMMKEDQFLLTFNVSRLNQKANKYHLIIREIAPELGTIDIPVAKLMRGYKN
jgi:hypothetical protein